MACTLFLAGALHSAADETPWDFARLMAELAQVQTSRARYSEVRRVAALRQPLALSGTLYYSRPARIEKRQILPFREVIQIDHEQLTVEREGKTRTIALASSPLIAALVESLRATLAGDGAELERLYSVQVEGAKERWALKLLPRDMEVAGVIDSINIAGSGSRVSRVEILEPGGDSSVMTIQHES
jgi:hypothetical protein